MSTQESEVPENESVRLVGESGAYKGNEYYVKKDVYIIGRAPDCDLVINENTVSGKHSRISKVGDHFTIQDMGSTNGTFVNDVKIDKKELRTNDRIKFDVFEFKYINPAEVARTVMTEAPDFSKAKQTMVRQQQVEPTQVIQEPQAPPAPPPPPQQPQARASEAAAVSSASFEKEGSLFVGLVVGLIVAFIFSYGGMFLSSLIATNFNIGDIANTFRAVVAIMPLLHTHVHWMSTAWPVSDIVVAVVLPLSLLLGGIITQSIGRKNRFGTAILFSILYAIIAFVAMFAVMNFNLETLKSNMLLFCDLGITDPLFNMIAGLGYIFGVMFVISFIGTLLGRK